MRIETEAACRTAAAAAGKTFAGVETVLTWPRGCLYPIDTYGVNFNRNAVGAGHSCYRLLCAAVVSTTGAPPPNR